LRELGGYEGKKEEEKNPTFQSKKKGGHKRGGERRGGPYYFALRRERKGQDGHRKGETNAPSPFESERGKNSSSRSKDKEEKERRKNRSFRFILYEGKSLKVSRGWGKKEDRLTFFEGAKDKRRRGEGKREESRPRDRSYFDARKKGKEASAGKEKEGRREGDRRTTILSTYLSLEEGEEGKTLQEISNKKRGKKKGGGEGALKPPKERGRGEHFVREGKREKKIGLLAAHLHLPLFREGDGRGNKEARGEIGKTSGLLQLHQKKGAKNSEGRGGKKRVSSACSPGNTEKKKHR